MRLLFVFILLVMMAGTGKAEHLWLNDIRVDEYNMTWNYNETFTGADSIQYRMSIDTGLGNNDSFISAWELLKADREMRKDLRGSIDKELDVRINNQTSGIEVIEVDSSLSPETIGNTHSTDAIVNRYSVFYRFKESILNAESVWFLGQAKSQVTIVLPVGVDAVNISGMNNISRNITEHVEISGSFKEITKERGEITLYLAKNTSYWIPEINVSITPAANTTKPLTDVLSTIRNASVIIAGAVIILLIYVFKVKRG